MKEQSLSKSFKTLDNSLMTERGVEEGFTSLKALVSVLSVLVKMYRPFKTLLSCVCRTAACKAASEAFPSLSQSLWAFFSVNQDLQKQAQWAKP